MIFYSLPPSGNAQKVRMALHLLNIEHEEVVLSGGAHKQPDFLALNPLGQVPAIKDGSFVLRDSQAILTYLAASHPNSGLGGFDAREQGQIAQWLSFSANEIAAGPATLRHASLFGVAVDRSAAQVVCDKVLNLLEARLAGREWLETDRMTIADLACSPYIALAHQAEVGLQHFPAIRRWLSQIETMSWFPQMPGWEAGSATQKGEKR